MTGRMTKYWIIPRVGDKELPRVGHLSGLLQSPHFLCSYVLKCVIMDLNVINNNAAVDSK